MRYIATASFYLLFLNHFSTFSQGYKYTKTIDSLIKVTNERPDDSLKVAGYGMLYEHLMFRDPEMSYNYAKKEYELSKKIGYKEGMAAGQLHFADYFKDRGKLDSARYYYSQSMKAYTKLNKTIGIIFVNHSLAIFEKELGNYDKAIEHANKNITLYKNRDTIYSQFGSAFNLIGAEYELLGGINQELGNYNIALRETLNALKFYEEKQDTLRQGDALMQIGSLEQNLENYDSAIISATKAYDIYDKYNDKQYKCYAANGIGKAYLSLGQPQQARRYFNDALKLSQEIKTKNLEGSSLVNLGMANMAIGQNFKAIEYFRKGLLIHEELGYKKSISTDLNNLAEAQINVNNFKEALRIINRSLSIANEIGAKDNLSTAYNLRYRVNKSIGHVSAALSDHELFKAINDTIFSTNKSQQIEELRTIYDTEKKEQQIAQQETEISLLEEQEKVSNLQKMLLGGGLGLSLLTLGFGFYGIRQKMKRNKIEKEKIATELKLKESELAFKKKELTTHALHLAKKNEVLEHIKQKAKELKTSENGSQGYQQLIHTINFDQQDDKNWENFTQYFEQVHKDFSRTVKDHYPEVTKNELRLMALLKMNLSSKEIATILNISSDGVKKARQRLRKKMNLSPEVSLESTVLSL